ncbi:MAG: SpoIIE family protein phosphatase [Planctomycetes bacterium]|nr:SpoIIE family protein phosphatase [Planctomycetota bacterium]
MPIVRAPSEQIVASLQLKSGPRSGEVLPLRQGRLVIGRHPVCDIVIDASAVSRQHAAISMQDGEVSIEDLRSRNGTLINGRPLVGSRRLADGDQIHICEQLLVYASGDRANGSRLASDSALGSQTSLFDEVIELGEHDSFIVSQLDVAQPQANAVAGPHAEAKLRAVRDISRAIGASLSLEEVLPRLLDGLFQIFPHTERGFVLLVDPTSGRPLLRARKTRGKPQAGPLRLSLSLIDRVVKSKRAILSADAATDSRFNASESIVDCRIRSVMCVPFLGEDGHVLGVIHVDAQDVLNGFVESDLEVLAGIAGQAAQAIGQALAHDNRVHQEQIKRDLELAHRVQQGLLPTKPPEIEGYEVFDFYEPALHVGGDFFAYVPLSEGRLAVVLADVSGKGVSAALVMAALSADVRYCLASERDLAKAVSLINESFLRGGWDDRFATLVVAVLEPSLHRVTLVSAGHLPVFLREASGKIRPIGIDLGCLPLGLDAERGYKACELKLEPGSTLVFYTDGISEAMDHEQRLYGLDRLEEVLAGTAGSAGGAGELGRRILADVERHAAGQARSDDMCLVCIGRSPATL